MIVTDITRDRRAAQNLRLHYERLKKRIDRYATALRHVQFALDSAPDGVVCIDKNGSFTYANTAACTLLGCRREEFGTLCLFDMIAGYTPDKWIYYWNLIRQQGPISYVYPLARKDGSVMHLEFQCVFFSLQGREGIYALMRDVTGRLQAQAALLSRERELSASQKRLQRLSAQVLSAQEQERRRLARELHDDLGQSLALLKLRLSVLARRIEGHENGLLIDCREACRSLEQIIENIRRLSLDLSPGFLEDLGLAEALRILCREFARHNGLKATCSIAKIDRFLTPEAQINLYRFCQEALTNIHKHARASSIAVLLKARDDVMTLRISDNGAGFDRRLLAADHAQRGMGLTTLEERACMLNGSCDIQSAPGRGTCVLLRFPVKAPL